MELKNELGVDNYIYLDPRVQKKMRQTSIPRKNTPFKDGIVFVIGGGNYVEYQNVQEYAKVTVSIYKIVISTVETAFEANYLWIYRNSDSYPIFTANEQAW